jgi:hypothetical protein
MGLFSKFFGPSFEQSCDKLAFGAECVFKESDRVCENILSVYNEEVLMGQRGADRQPVRISNVTLLGWKCTGLVPLFARLMQLHPREKDRAYKLTEVFISGLINIHPDKERIIGEDYNPFRLLMMQTVMLDSGFLLPLHYDHIISQYKQSLSKLIGRAEDVSDLISRYEQSNTLLSNAVTALALPSKIY